jgi:Icc-related predicted phosphoesterase
MLSDSHADVIVVAGDIKGKGHLAVTSSVQNRVLTKNHVVFHTLINFTVLVI